HRLLARAGTAARIPGGGRCCLPATTRAQLLLERLARDTDALRDPADVDVAERWIDGRADRRQQPVERATRPIDVVEVVPLLQHLQLALEYVERPVEERCERRGAALANQRVRVLALGQRDYERVDPGLQQRVRRAERRAPARSVAVIEQQRAPRIPREQVRLLGRHRGAHAGNRVLDATTRERHIVHVTLDDERRTLAPDRVARPVQAVENGALVEDRRLGRIEIFRLVTAGEYTSTERDHATAHLGHREHQPVAETVVRLAASLALLDQPRIQQHVILDTVLMGRAAQRLPVVGRIADAEPLDGILTDLALLQVAQCMLARGLAQHSLEEVCRERDGLVQLAVGILLLARPFPARDLHANAVRDLAHRVGEREPLVLHEETENVARLAAAEALEEALRWDHVERRRLLVMERAERTEVLARALEGQQLADHLDDVRAFAHLIDQMIANHARSATVTPASPSPMPPGRKACTRRSPFSTSVTTSRSAPVPLP